MPAVLETPPGRDAYGWVEVHEDRVQLVGVDTCMSCDLKLQPAAVQRQQRTLQRLASSSNGGSSSCAAEKIALSGAMADIVVEVTDGQRGDKVDPDVLEQLASCTVSR